VLIAFASRGELSVREDVQLPLGVSDQLIHLLKGPAMSEKHVCVTKGNDTIDLTLGAGTTAADVLSQINASSDFFLSTRDGQPFGLNEVIYDQIRDGEKLFCSPPASVAGGFS
jgi:hypothetical protein